MGKDWIELKIDSRMVNGRAVIDHLRGERRGGIPWMVLLDASGKELVSSDGPNGNVGCPVTEAERAWFLKMLAQTRQHASEADLAVVEAKLAAFAKKVMGGV